TPEGCDAYEIALLDQDDAALGDAARRVAEAERRAGSRAAVRYIQGSVRTLLRHREITRSLGRYHVVHSLGLFDYLTAPVARSVPGTLYAVPAPGGLAILATLHVRNPPRWHMEYWMDWSLLSRTEEELSALAAGLPGASSSIAFEATGCQMFLFIRKGAA